MSKLYVRRGNRGKPFHPRIEIKDTGFCENHVCMQFFRGECAPCGDNPMSEWREKHGDNVVSAMVTYYFSELRRTGHVEVKV